MTPSTAQPARTAKTAKGEATRQRLMDATVALVCERGWAGTSVDAICKSAGAVKTALYHHFGNKDGLLRALIDRNTDVWVAEIDAEVSKASTPLEQLDNLLAGLRRIFDEHSQVIRVTQIVVNEAANLPPEVLASARRLNQIAEERITARSRMAMGEALADADLLAHTITAIFRGILYQHLLHPDGIDVDRYFRDLKWTIIASVSERLERPAREAARRRRAS